MTIKIEDAINIMQLKIDRATVADDFFCPEGSGIKRGRLIAAWKLGISAMKRIKQIRDGGGNIGMPVLRGETPPEDK